MRALCGGLLFGAVIAVTALLVAAALGGLAGYDTVVVYGGSMGSALPAGSVAVTETVDAEAVEPGDIIAFHDTRGSLGILHRVVSVEVVDGQLVATTRGDANASSDPQPIQLAGRGSRVLFSVPRLGFLLVFARSRLGLGLFVAAPAALWFGRRIVGAWLTRHRAVPTRS